MRRLAALVVIACSACTAPSANGVPSFSPVAADGAHCQHHALVWTAEPDPDLAAVDAMLELPEPQLAFPSDDPATRARSSAAFSQWLVDLTHLAHEATEQFGTAGAADEPPTLRAMAGAILVDRAMAAKLSGLVIPLDIRTGDYAEDKIDAFCSVMAEAAQPLLTRADEIAHQCAARAVDNSAPAWWSAACSAVVE